MTLVHWKRFTWDLAALPPEAPDLAAPFKIRPCEKDEEKLARNVIFSSFKLDSDWSDALNLLQGRLDSNLGSVFGKKEPAPCLVLTHGARIIGASALDLREDALFNLVFGPAVLMEYRNRGMGTSLLYHSLKALKDGGLRRAVAISKANLPAAKFLFPKFESVSQDWEME